MTEPAIWSVTPFVTLLLAMALLPFIHRHHWENRRLITRQKNFCFARQ